MVQFSPVAQLCPTLCDIMDCSMPGFPVLHYLREFAQTHVQWVDDAIPPSHPVSPLSLLALNVSQHQGLSSESALCIRWPKYWSFSFSICHSSEYSELISFHNNSLLLYIVIIIIFKHIQYARHNSRCFMYFNSLNLQNNPYEILTFVIHIL